MAIQGYAIQIISLNDKITKTGQVQVLQGQNHDYQSLKDTEQQAKFDCPLR